MDILDAKLNQSFPGKVVRKDLTKQIKEGANVPVYVLEYLLGMHCATDDEATIAEGIIKVKKGIQPVNPKQPKKSKTKQALEKEPEHEPEHECEKEKVLCQK